MIQYKRGDVNMNILYKHNAVAYEKVKETMQSNDRTCIIHATGTGKSFIALQLMMDYLEASPNNHIYYITPLNGIKEQINEHINALGLPQEIFNNIEFVTYQALTTKSRNELESLNIDMLVVDEFHHLGAREWTAAINKIIESHPKLKIFGMSATSVRERGTSKEDDVAESFFGGNVASAYDLAQAIADGVLPAPQYHAALTFLEDECKELEEKVKNGKASAEEKNEYNKIISSIKKQISMMEVESTTDIIRKYIKPNGKYIYFCPKGVDIKELQDNFLRMLPEESRNNVEFYQVHSSEYSTLENQTNHHNFYNNIDQNGNNSSQKLRVMFAIDMYNEGIHVPDIDGVIMGRNTQSEIVFYQQLGRALAVKKKNDNDDIKLESPLVIDLMDNFRSILKLYNKIQEKNEKLEQEKTNEITEFESKNYSETASVPLNFGINEELIDIITKLEEIKYKINSILGFEKKLKEAYDYLQTEGHLPNSRNVDIKFSDGVIMGIWITRNKLLFQQIQNENEYAKAIIQELEKIKGLSFEEKLKEAYDYLQINGHLPNSRNVDIKFSDGAIMGGWLSKSKQILFQIQEENEYAKAIIQEFGLSFEEKLKEAYDYLQAEGHLPNSRNVDIKFSDGAIMGGWLSKSKQILFQIQEENEYAKAIIQEFGLSFEEKLKEAYNYLKINGHLPNGQNKEIKFSDGKLMGSWLRRNKSKIQKMQEENEYAKTIILELERKKGLSFDDKLKEAYDYLKAKGHLPPLDDTEIKFSDGAIMGGWLSKNKLQFQQKQGENQFAKAIIQELKGRKKISFEEKLKEAYDYLQNKGYLPTLDDKNIEFSDGTVMGSWLSTNKSKLQELEEINEYAKAIIQELKGRKGLSFDDKLIETYNYLQNNGYLPNSKNKEIKFSDGSQISSWLFTNKSRLQELEETNEYAKAIIQELEKRRGLNFEENVKEAYDYLQAEGHLPSFEDAKIKFSDGVILGDWIGRNRKKIIEESKKGKIEAITIVDYLDKIKELTNEDKIHEAYEYFQIYRKIPKRKDREIKFSDGTAMGDWIGRNTEMIFEESKNGNDEAMALYQYLKSQKKLSNNERIIEAIRYIEMYKSWPTIRETEITFSDGVFMADWISRHKKSIFEAALNGSIEEEKFVSAIIEIKPDYFKSVIKALKTKEEFDELSVFEQIKAKAQELKKEESLRKEKEGDSNARKVQ